MRWIHRDDQDPDAPRTSDLPDGRAFDWMAGEAGMVREVRRHLVKERCIDKKTIAFTGYWRRDLTHRRPDRERRGRRAGGPGRGRGLTATPPLVRPAAGWPR